jgi:hypothetical protein
MSNSNNKQAFRQSFHNITIQPNTRGSILSMIQQGKHNTFNEIDDIKFSTEERNRYFSNLITYSISKQMRKSNKIEMDGIIFNEMREEDDDEVSDASSAKKSPKRQKKSILSPNKSFVVRTSCGANNSFV